MKRPLAVTGFVYLAASAVALLLGHVWLPAVGGALALCFAVSMMSGRIRRRGYIPLAFAAALAAVVSVGIYDAVKVVPAEGLEGKQVIVEAELTDLPYMNNQQYYYAVNARELKSRDGKTLHDVKLLLSSSEPLDAAPSDIITTEVRLGSSQHGYDLSKGIIYRGYIPYPQTVRVSEQESKPLYYYVLKLRHHILERIDAYIPGEKGAFVKAFLLGDKYSLSEDTVSELRTAGLSHVIVVSGMHLTLLAYLLMLLLTKLFRMSKRSASVICIAAVLLYMALTGFGTSAFRAGIMFLSVSLSGLVFRRSDPLTSLALAVLVIIVSRPYAAVDISLLLSFSATLGIILMQRPMSVYISGKLFGSSDAAELRLRSRILPAGLVLVDVLTATLSAILFALPVTILYFRQAPLYGVIFSCLTYFTLPLIMTCSMLMLLFDMTVFLSFMAVPFAAVAGVFTDQILLTSGAVSHLPFAMFSFTYSFVPVWICLCMATAAVLYLMKKKRRRVRIFVLTVLVTFAAGYMTSYFMEKDAVTVCIPQTGEGLTVFVKEGDSTVVLACGGGKGFTYGVTGCMRSLSVSGIDYLLLLKKNRALSGYAEELAKEHDIGIAGIYDPEAYGDEIIDPSGEVLSFSSKDGTIHSVSIKSITADCLREKGLCAVFAEIHGYRILVCTSGTDCSRLPDEWKSADMLIVNGELKNAGVLGYNTLVISDGEKDSHITYRELDKAAMTFRTYLDGDIAFRLGRNNEIRETRERIWLS